MKSISYLAVIVKFIQLVVFTQINNFLRFIQEFKVNNKIKGMGGVSLFSQLDFILKNFIQATTCILQISKIQSNF